MVNVAKERMNVVTEHNFREVYPEEVRERYWKTVERSLAEVFGKPTDAARRYRELVESEATPVAEPDDTVVVLVAFNLASSLERKNPYAAIAAFRAAFGDRRDRLLVLKVGHREHFPSEFARLVEVADAPSIRLEVCGLPGADNHALLAASDVVLSLHRGEAFGLVLAEAMLLGKPVVATGWSGNMEYMDHESAALVGYRLVTAHDSRGTYSVAVSEWAEPCLTDAVAHLRRPADDELERRSLGARARNASLSRLGPSRLQAAIDELGLSSTITRQL